MAWDPNAKEKMWKRYCETNDAPSYHAFAQFVHDQCTEAQLRAKFIAELKDLREHAQLKKGNTVSWNLYYFLCVAGGIYALCSGFDGMVSVLSLLAPQIGLGILIAFGLLSALSALGIFIARDRPSIMDSLDLQHDPYHQIVDEYLYHVQSFNHQAIEDKWQPGQEFSQEFKNGKKLEAILADKQKLNSQQQSSLWVGIQSHFVMAIGAILFFSDGFFVGENVAMLLGPLLCAEAVSFTMVISLTMGLFALAAYWYVERSSLQDYLYNHVATDEYLRQSYAQENASDLHRISIFQPASPQLLQAENLVYAL